MGCGAWSSGARVSAPRDMPRVLVTGASGYIGQHLTLALTQAGWQVRGLSRSPQPGFLQEIEWIAGDVTEARSVERAVEGIECVVHLACLPLNQSAQDPTHALRVNVEGTVLLLEAARRVGIKRFVFASTGQVYGGQARLPNAETNVPQPDSPYAVSKLSAEMWCAAYARAYQLPVQILRLFNVYGASADGSLRPTVESIFLQQVKQSQRPQIRGNPQSGRDFIHVDDVLCALLLVLDAPAHPSPINIGTGILTTLYDLARLAARVMGRSGIEPEVIETGELPVRFQAATALARRVLGFHSEITLEQGLARVSNSLT